MIMDKLYCIYKTYKVMKGEKDERIDEAKAKVEDMQERVNDRME